jgi:diguanylate cyclase (GGDEF)-like protein
VAFPAIPVTDGEAGRPGVAPAAERTALLACADATAQASAARWLATVGFEVIRAVGVGPALESLTHRRPAAVITDLPMTDERGRGLCDAVRQCAGGSAIPVIAVCSGVREIRAALDAGAADVIQRPVDWHVMALRAERLVRLVETEAALAGARSEIARLNKKQVETTGERRERQGFDALTGLPDLERLEAELERALVTATDDSQVAVALFDIEHLVVLNTRLGRARANSVLQQVAQRLVGGLRSDEVLRATAAGPSMSMAARVGGGLFAALLTGVPGWHEARGIVRLLLDRVSGRYFAGDEEIVLSASVGVAMAPGDGLTAEGLIQKAELAAAEALENGGSIRCYGQSARRVTERSRAIARQLAGALARGELRMHYQPLVEGTESHICAAEALLRWESPELGSVPPTEFVPLAEELGLMVPIGTWALRTACEQVRSWIDAGLPAPRIAVNVSLCQLVRGDFDGVVADCLRQTAIDPGSLELELSERGVLRADPEILRQLHAIRKLGVRLAIDDFGTGNSAVVYLKQFPIDVLKIDQSFVRGVSSSSEDAAITCATIAMARQLGLRVVAEGVEEQGQMDFLLRYGCSEYQGFLFSPAVPPDEFAEMLKCGIPAARAHHGPFTRAEQ